MKRAVNFRLSNKTLVALSRLENKTHLPKTEIVERAIQLLVKKELSAQNPLLKYVGIINETEAESMLDAVNASKHSKDIKTGL